MKLSLGWAQKYSNVDFSKINSEEWVNKIGSQLGAADEVINFGNFYVGIVVVKIVKCEQHPDADKLKLCLVDDGGAIKNVSRTSDGFVQVVCGGPNAKANMFAVWIPPGVVVPSSWNKDKLVLEAREIRGQVSNGMLASPAELAISDEHEGIIEITPQDIGREPKTGEAFTGLYGLDDLVIDIENKMFTHRPDLFGVLGIARELAGITNQKFESPNWYLGLEEFALKPANEQQPVEVKNSVPELVPRFTALPMSNITIAPSPYWLQSGLTRVGIKPINNVVDITNFVMYITGQPVHAFDFDKIKSKAKAGLEARLATEGEQLTLLGGKSIKLDTQDIVIAALDGPAIALGGIMGGAETEVQASTRNIIVECANFNMYSVRRSAMRHGLFTEAAIRFTKGQSPHQNLYVLAFAAKLMAELIGAQVAGQPADVNHAGELQAPITTTSDFINSRLGLTLEAGQIKQLLANVELGVEQNGNELIITPPYWRMDLKLPEDIVEETGRLYGYDNLPARLPGRDLAPPPKNHLFDFKYKLRNYLAKSGANEVLTYSFVHSKLIESAGQDTNLAFQLRNALSPDLQFYRLSLGPCLLEKIHPNIKLGYKDFALFELGKIYIKTELDEEKVPSQHHRLALAVSQESLGGYYSAKKLLDGLVAQLGIADLIFEPLDNCSRTLSQAWTQTALAYEPQRSAVIIAGSNIIGIVGEPKTKLKSALKLSGSAGFFELDTEQLLELAQPLKYLLLNKFPKTSGDMTLRLPTEHSYRELETTIYKALELEAQAHGYGYQLRPIDIFGKDSDKTHLNYSFRVELWHPAKTLITDEINAVLDKTALACKSVLHAERG